MSKAHYYKCSHCGYITIITSIEGERYKRKWITSYCINVKKSVRSYRIKNEKKANNI